MLLDWDDSEPEQVLVKKPSADFTMVMEKDEENEAKLPVEEKKLPTKEEKLPQKEKLSVKEDSGARSRLGRKKLLGGKGPRKNPPANEKERACSIKVCTCNFIHELST